MRRAPLLIVPLSNKAAYLDRYAEPDKGWTDRDEARWPVPYWDVDAGMASLLMLLTAVDEGLGACFFGVPPERVAALPGGLRRARGSTGRSAACRSATPGTATAAPPRCAAAGGRRRRSCTAAAGEPRPAPLVPLRSPGTDELRRPYDRMADEFLAHAEDGAYNAHYDRPAVLELLGDVAGLRVLDAGAVPGCTPRSCSPEARRWSGSTPAPRWSTSPGPGSGTAPRSASPGWTPRSPTADDVVDVVLCALAIHYVAARHAAFAELHRVLRPGGAVVLSTPAPDDGLAAQGRVALRPGAGDRRLVDAVRAGTRCSSGASRCRTCARRPRTRACHPAPGEPGPGGLAASAGRRVRQARPAPRLPGAPAARAALISPACSASW